MVRGRGVEAKGKHGRVVGSGEPVGRMKGMKQCHGAEAGAVLSTHGS